MNTKATFCVKLSACLVLAGAVFSVNGSAQSQEGSQPSVAEAARRAREKKQIPAKPAKVITNDDLLPAPPWMAAPAAPAPTGDTAQASGASSGQAAGAAAAKELDKDSKKEKQEELRKLRKDLADAQGDLDLLQRQQALQRDTYYSNPDYAHDTGGKAKLDSLQTQITDKQQAIEELKTKVTALQELLGADAPQDKPATPPQQ